MPAVLRYARDRVRLPKTGQRVRLQATVTPATAEIFNLTSSFGNYARASHRDGTIQFAYTPLPVPVSYEFEAPVTTTGDCTRPRFCWTPRQRLHLVYHCAVGTAERTSDDDGLTWSGETIIFSACDHPDITCDQNGTILRAAYEPATGKITATRQNAGDVAASAAFYLKNASAVDITIEDDCFRLVADPRGLWWLHCRLLGGGATTLLYSSDDCASFSVTSGAVPGITSGTHPGMLAGHEGTLWAWAYLGGELTMTRRAAGEVNWSAPASVQDDAAADLGVADIPPSMALAWEGPERVVLATILTGESLPSDHGSADAATSFERF